MLWDECEVNCWFIVSGRTASESKVTAIAFSISLLV